jgi:hypothetical protein
MYNQIMKTRAKISKEVQDIDAFSASLKRHLKKSLKIMQHNRKVEAELNAGFKKAE